MAKKKHTKALVDGIVQALHTHEKGKTVAPRVQYVLEKMSDQAKGETTAHIQSSVPLSEAEKESVRKIIAKLANHPIEPVFRVNKELVAGIRVQVGDLIVDTSLKHQLHQMAQLLTQ